MTQRKMENIFVLKDIIEPLNQPFLKPIPTCGFINFLII